MQACANPVQLEQFCKINIYSASVQPRTNPSKFGKFWQHRFTKGTSVNISTKNTFPKQKKCIFRANWRRQLGGRWACLRLLRDVRGLLAGSTHQHRLALLLLRPGRLQAVRCVHHMITCLHFLHPNIRIFRIFCKKTFSWNCRLYLKVLSSIFTHYYIYSLLPAKPSRDLPTRELLAPALHPRGTA